MLRSTRAAAARKIILGLLFVLAGWSLPAAAQGLLPSSFGPWTASGTSSHAAPLQVEQFAADQGGILREYGLSSAERREYAQGGQTATVALYSMVDPSAAFGAFTYLREATMEPLSFGKAAQDNARSRKATAQTSVVPPSVEDASIRFTAGSRVRALVVVGNFLLDVSSSNARPQDKDLDELASGLLPRADRRPYPFVQNFLPPEGLVTGSEKYVLGPQALAQVFPSGAAGPADWLGFDKSAEAVVARYHLAGAPKGEEAILMLAAYPDQQIAADRYGLLGKTVALNVDPTQANGKPVIFGTRSTALIALVANVSSREAAADFLKQVHYSIDLTWDEPTHELTDPSISTIVVGAILDTGSIMMLALAAGLGFGGFRLLVKVLLPGKVFDRNDQVEILQLGLGSKPIKSTDFYLMSGDSPKN